MQPKFYALAIGELKPDFLSSRIQKYLSLKHGLEVNWSHNAILVEGAGPEFDGVWDSTGRGFKRCTIEEATDNGAAVIRVQVELQVKCPQKALGWLLGNQDRWYANLQYVLYILPPGLARWIGRILPSFIRKLFANGRALSVCSETLGYFILDNCVGADRNLVLWDGDRVDPYMAIVEARKYAAQPGQ